MARERLFVTGLSGLLGLNAALQWRDRFDIAGSYRTHPVSIAGVEAIALDLEDASSVRAVVDRFRPHVVLHAAALADVDHCERDPALAARLNVDVTRYVSEAARAAGARLVHISTDQIFAGDRPFYDETAAPHPVNVYGRTKLEAERAAREICPDALIVRTNFLGWGTSIRASFIDWVVRSLAGGAPVRMFTDVFFTPIAVNDLLDCIPELLERRIVGTLNVAGSERLSKYEAGIRVARLFGYAPGQIEPSSINGVPLEARRPRDMSLDTGRVARLLGHAMPAADALLERLTQLHATGWPEALEAAVGSGSSERSRVAPDDERAGGQIRKL